MLYIVLIITISYLILIGLLIRGFNKVNAFHFKEIVPDIRFSIVIPFRNEAANLPHLLKSIDALEYPKRLFEVILVDDDSTDDSLKIINRFLANARNDIAIIKNIRTTNSPKKDAITNAIRTAKHEWIITTDADCTLPKHWLNSFDAFIQENQSQCVIAPVKFNITNGFLSRFQILDMLSLQGATIGGFGINKPFLCNGANLAYKKALFFELNGFEGNDTIASGDDVFFLEKAAKRHPKQVNYLKSEKAIVNTLPEISWQGYIQQRVRWASKTKAYHNRFGKLTGLIVLLMNILIIALLIFSFNGLFNFKLLFYILVIKFSIDFYLIYKAASFFNQKAYLLSYFSSFIIYPFISTYIAIIALFRPYTWKGRTFKA